MKILVVGGGTGGHIMPAVATVKEIFEIEPKAEVEFWTDRKNYKAVTEMFEVMELESSLKESVVKRESEEKIGRKKVTVVKRTRRREIVEGREVRVRKICAGKFRRYAGWKKEDYVKHFGILIRDVVFKNIANLGLFLVGMGQSWVRLSGVGAVFDRGEEVEEGGARRGIRERMRVARPDVIFLKGGFVGLPVGMVAGWLKIPYLVHESDATPGLANRILRKRAKVFLLGVSKAEYAENERFVGVPIGEEFKKVSEAGQRRLKEELGFLSLHSKENNEGGSEASGDAPGDIAGGERLVLVVVGGSQGSEHINTAVVRVLPELLKVVQVGIVTGKGHFREVVEGAKEALGVREKATEEINTAAKVAEFAGGLKIWDFSKEVQKLFGAADMVVSRAGASTIAELAVMEKPTILVPFEALPGGHQAKNARILEERGAAVVLMDEEMVDQPVKLLKLVREVAGNEGARKEMAKRIGREGKEKVAKTIAETIIEVGKR